MTRPTSRTATTTAGLPGIPCRSRRSHRRGFTLIELLIVLVVLAVIAALTIPTYNTVVNSAKDSAAKSELMGLSRQATALAASTAANGGAFDLTMFANTTTAAAPGVSAAGAQVYLAGLDPTASASTVLTAYPNPGAGTGWVTGPSVAYLQVSVGISPSRTWVETAMRSSTGKCIYVMTGLGSVKPAVVEPVTDPCQARANDDGSDGPQATVAPTNGPTGATVPSGAGATPASGVSAPNVGTVVSPHYALGGVPMPPVSSSPPTVAYGPAGESPLPGPTPTGSFYSSPTSGADAGVPCLIANAQTTLTWTAAPNATEYYVYKDGVYLASTTSTSYTYNGTATATWKVYAGNNAGWTLVLTKQTSACGWAPTLSASVSGSTVTLSWTNNPPSGTAQTYTVSRATHGSSSFTTLGTVTSPFPLPASLSTTDTPGTGSWDYQVSVGTNVSNVVSVSLNVAMVATGWTATLPQLTTSGCSAYAAGYYDEVKATGPASHSPTIYWNRSGSTSYGGPGSCADSITASGIYNFSEGTRYGSAATGFRLVDGDGTTVAKWGDQTAICARVPNPCAGTDATH